MSRLARDHSSESGSVVLSVLVVVVVVAVLAFGLLANSTAAYRMQASNARRVQAVLLAEGGAEAAYNLLKTDSSYRTNTNFTAAIGSEAVAGTISVDGSSYTIGSTATVGGQSHSVSLRVMTVVPPPPAIYGYGLYAAKSIEGKENCKVIGSDIVSDGEIKGFSVEEESKGFRIRDHYKDKKKDDEPEITFPALDLTKYQDYPPPEYTEKNNDVTITVNGYRFRGTVGKSDEKGEPVINNITIESPSGDGVLFINGDLLAKNNLTFRGNITVIVVGDLVCKNSLKGENGKLHLVVGGDTRDMNNMELAGTVTVGGSFKAKNNTVVTFHAVEDSEVPGYDPTEIAGWSREWVR
ncbi:MAG TPA: hypothetical protein PKM09_09370 [Bacillota bacterium]|nr:hypothetical protein [Bacillota bacterium]